MDRCRRFPCPSLVPVVVAYDSGLVATEDPPASRGLDPMSVVYGWFDGICCGYDVPHLKISAATELFLGFFSVLIEGKFRCIASRRKLGIASGAFLFICSCTWKFS
jgi:hypothetical protein